VTLVEREQHVAWIGDWLSGTTTGPAPILLLQGPPGSGMTTLLYRLIELARERGAATFTAAGTPAERTLPFGIVDQLLRNCTGESCRQQAASVVEDIDAARPEAPGDTGVRTARAHDALHRFIVDTAARAPVVIAVDDVRYADAASYRCLTGVLRRLGPSRVLLVATDRSGPARDPLIADLAGQPGFHRLPLAQLSRAGVARLAGRHDAGMLLDRTGGNPLLLHAALRPAPAYADALLHCVRAMDAPAVDVARAMAFLSLFTDGPGDSSPARMLDIDPELVEPALSALRAGGVLTGGRFRHPDAAAILVADTPAGLRADLHARAARTLHDRGAPGVTVARHIDASGRAPEAWAVPALGEAVRDAVRHGRTRSAARLLERVVDADVTPGIRASALARLADIEWQQDPASATGRLTALVAEAHAGRLPAAEVAVLARRLLWSGRRQEASALRDMPSTGPAGTDPLARRESWYAATALDADPASVLEAGPGSDAAAMTERLLDRPPGAPPYEPELCLAALLALVRSGGDGTEQARRWCARLSAQASGDGPETSGRFLPAVIAAISAELAFRRGDLVEAGTLARTALDGLSHRAWGVALGLPTGIAALAAVRTGDLDEAADLLGGGLPDVFLDNVYGRWYRFARGEYLLATDAARAALADFRACDGPYPDVVPWRVGAAEALLRLDDRTGAARLLETVLRAPEEHDPRTHGGALRLVATARQPRQRLPLLRHAADLHERHGHRFELARVLGDLGRAYHSLGERKRARLAINRAVHLAGSCQAEALRHELLPDGDMMIAVPVGADNSPGITALTPSERRVASMAVLGYTNREIAARLYVQPGTVEQHLTKVFRKLSVSQRDQLPTRLAAEDFSRSA
jgi:DNA-binding CsgD family transcriptional regulator